MFSFSIRQLIALVAVVLLIIGAGYVLLHEPTQQDNTQPVATTPPVSPPPPPTSEKSCIRGGCSGEICAESNGRDPIVSNCMFIPKYACYKTARCERQANGSCGWTQTEELRACLAQPSLAE